ncbi:MAG: helix-turn-helix domain-containing protein [Oscillospiraceae bacterium]|jgi:transcriptional regulator with XRE-family HTH domain|nr:helix-turn-helix domain-containing protein [Oscillospiraceae bacterium]
MDQIKIGKFIAECRKKQNLTQAQLAEKLDITDRAISKWETGKAMPDSDIMLDLCDILGIKVNELLCGEMIEIEHKDEQLNELIFQMAKNEERYHKRLLHSAYVIIATSLTALICLMSLISLLIPECGFQDFLIIVSVILFIIPCMIALKFKAETGYYECKNCQHMFVPNYKEIAVLMQTPTRRLLKCTKCGKWTWCKKLTKR